MTVDEMDALANGAAIATFGEAVTFSQGGASRAVFELRSESAEQLGPVNRPSPSLLISLQELTRLGAREGSTVIVRGVTYTLMNGVDDPIVDAGGMVRLELREYA